MASYRVRQGRSVVGPDGQIYRGGQGLPDTWERRIYKTLMDEPEPAIENATIEAADELVVPNNAPKTPALPGIDPAQRQGAIDAARAVRDGAPARETLTVQTGSQAAKVEVSNAEVPAAKANASGKWNLDPATLEGKTLEQLNIQALEIDPSISPFADVAEAVAMMSMDFQPADKK